MILSVTFSKPSKNVAEILGKEFKRVKIKLMSSSADALENESYFAELYTEKQVFHRKFSKAELDDFIKAHAGKTFKNCVERTENEEITVMASKRGRITELRRALNSKNGAGALGIGAARSVAGAERIGAEGNEALFARNCGKPDPQSGERPDVKNIKFLDGFLNSAGAQNRRKNYILEEGRPVPFLVRLGIMTAEGKVVSAKYGKFRQINRFLEFVDDILGDVLAQKKAQNDGEPLSIVDFGSGKSYLTFAVQYFLTEIKKVPCRIFGLDLKKDVVDYCSSLARGLGLENLTFAVGDIADFDEDRNPDIVITLHACDTATDYALDYAVKRGAKAVLSVPCCQHEINSQLAAKVLVRDGDAGRAEKAERAGSENGGNGANSANDAKESGFELLLKYGLIKERFSALLTDAIRGDLLEQNGYKVQMLEFIDDSATPKNLLIRAVKKSGAALEKKSGGAKKNALSQEILKTLEIRQTLEEKLRK